MFPIWRYSSFPILGMVFSLNLEVFKAIKEIVPLQLLSINLGGGFKYFSFSPLPGKDSHFD